MSNPRVFFYVQYLQGVGHLYRAGHVARAMAKAGLDVDLVSGGAPVPGLDAGGARLHQLTPIKCRNGDFSDLIDTDGRSIGDAFKDHRREELLSLFAQRQPMVLIVEAFPFGRRKMRFELLPLIETARSASNRPIIVCSVRDILQVSGKPARVRETLDTIDQYFDRILVHGDPSFAALDATFSGAGEISGKIHYTGMVTDTSRGAEVSRGRAGGEILVSAGGGGTLSEILLAAAIAARALSSAKNRPWRLLAGPNLPEREFLKLAAQVPQGVTLERNRNDFASLLARCALSVSQAGYNTVIDLLRCGCRSVLVPYCARGESEQLFRARRIAELGLARVVEEMELGPRSLARAIDDALTAPPPGAARFNFGGAEESARLVSAWLK